MYQDENGFYHASSDCWQQYFGYNDLYDFCFEMGTSMRSEKFPFSSGGADYIIWLWMGDYINLGAGAEAGIYYGGPYHYSVDTDLTLYMSMTVYLDGQQIMYHSDTNWWLTSFDPSHLNVSAENMKVIFRFYFSDQKDLFESLYATYASAPGWTFYPSYYFAVYTFG